MDTKTICRLIDENCDELYNLVSKLISINSENFGSWGNEKECPEYIKEICIKLGLETQMYSPLEVENYEKHPDYLAGRGLENRYNVTARWKGKEDVDALMLMGHHDTVEIGNLDSWTVGPLSGEIRDNKIWGRGACDDKYALAACLFVIDVLKKNGFEPSKNLLFTAYCDEEHGGSNGALSSVLRYPCERIINMDCTDFAVWQCASGGQEVGYHYHTKESVDSARLTAKAIPIVMEEIDKFAARRKKELSENKFYQGTNIPDTSCRYMLVKAGNNGTDLGKGEFAITFYTDKTKEEIYKEYEEMEKVLSKRLDEMGIVSDGFVPKTRFFHYTFTEPDNEAIRDLQECALEVSGRKLTPCASCLSDLSVIQKYGPQNTFGFGIGRDFGEYGGAHQADEFIECDKLLEYTKMIALYVIRSLS